MDPITAFLSSTIAGNLVMGVLGETTAENVLSFWDRLNLGNHDLQSALTDAYSSTFASMEVSMNPQGTLKNIFHRVSSGQLLTTRGEKELAKDFTEKILTPFMDQRGLNEKSREEFLKASRKACRHYQKMKEKFFDFEELLAQVRRQAESNETGGKTVMMNASSRETFYLIEAILFAGQDLAEAPDLKESQTQATRAILQRLEYIGSQEVRNYFTAAKLPDNIFFEFLQEQNLFMNGLIFNLELAIKNNQKVANILNEYRTQDTKKEKEAERNKHLEEQKDLGDKITKLEQAITLTRQAGIDVSVLETQLDPLRQQMTKVDLVIRRIDSWDNYLLAINERMADYSEYFGELTGRLDTLTEMVREQDAKLDTIITTTEETKSLVEENLDETVRTRKDISNLTKEVKFLQDLIQNFKTDVSLGDIQKQNLIAGIDPNADFDVHSLFDFKETHEYELGKGAVGIVYRATHKGTGKPCALKMLKEEYRRDPVIVARFLREGAVLKGMQHPNLVYVDEVGGGGNKLAFYIQMELIKGDSLRKRIDEKRLPRDWDTLFSLTKQLCGVVEMVHKNGIIHRDINPNNIIITDDNRVKLMDFGVARIVGLGGLTLQGQVVGTSNYMSPEQKRGESLDYRSDIFSLGLVLYELFTYRTPEAPPKTVRQYNPSVPEWVDSLLGQCLIPDKNYRLASVEKLGKAFKGEGADPADIKRYEDTFYIFLEDGRISKLEDRKLTEMRDELCLPLAVYERIEEKVRSRVLEERLQEAAAELQKGDCEAAREFYTIARTLSPTDERVARGIQQLDTLYPQSSLASPPVTQVTPTPAAPIASTVAATTTGPVAASLTAPVMTPVEAVTRPLPATDEAATKLAPVATVVRTQEMKSAPFENLMRWKECRVLEGTTATTASVAVSINGAYILAAGADKTLRVWDAENSRILREFPVDALINTLTLARDNRHVALGCNDWSIRLWDIESGVEVKRFQGHVEPVKTVAFTSDSGFLVSGGADSVARIWDVETGKELRRLEGHEGHVTSLSIAHDNSLIVTGSTDKTVRLWDFSTGKELRKITGHTSPILTVTLTPDNRHILSTGSDPYIKMWNTGDGTEVKRFTQYIAGVGSLAISQDGKYVVTGCQLDQLVRIWEMETGAMLKRLVGHSGPVTSVAISSDGTFIVTGASKQAWDKGTVRVWSLPASETGLSDHVLQKLRETMDMAQQHMPGALTPTPQQWENWRDVVRFADTPDNISSIFLTCDNRYLLTCLGAAGIRILEVDSGKEIRTVSPKIFINRAIATGDNKRIIACFADKSVRIFNFENGEDIKVLWGHTDSISQMIATPDSRFLVTAGNEGLVRTWDLETGEQVYASEAQPQIYALALSPDSRFIAAGGNDKSAILFDFATGEELKRLEANPGTFFYSLGFSPDGKYLVTAGQDYHAHVWDVERGSEIRKFSLSALVRTMTFSTCGKFLITGGDDKNVRIWEFETGRELKKMTGHSGILLSVAISSDNGFIVSCGNKAQWDQKPIHFWTSAEAITEDPAVREKLQAAVNAGYPVAYKSIEPVNPRWEAWDEVKKPSVPATETHMALLPDGIHVATVTTDNILRIFDIERGAEVRTHQLKQGAGKCSMAVSFDSRYVALGNHTGIIELYSLEDGKEIKTLFGHTEAPTSLVFSGDGSILVSGSNDGSIRQWDVESGKELRKLEGHQGQVTGVNLSPDGRYIVSTGQGKIAFLWDFITGKEIKRFEIPTWFSGFAAVFTPDGKHLILAGSDPVIRIRDIEEGKEIKQLQGHRDQVRRLQISRDGRFLVSGGNDKTIRIWDIESGKEIKKLTGHTGMITTVLLAPDNRFIVSRAFNAQWDTPLRIWGETVKHEEDRNIREKLQSAIGDNRYAEVLKSVVPMAQSFDAWKELKKLTGHQNQVNAVCVTSDGRRVVTGSSDATIRIWDTETGTEKMKLACGQNCAVNALSLSPGGRYLVSGHSDWSVRFWNIESGEAIKTMYGHLDQVLSVAIGYNDRFAVTGGTDGFLRTWDMESGKELRKLDSNHGSVTTVALTTDNRYIVSSGADKIIRIWDMANGAELRNLEGHTALIRVLRLSQDNRFIVSTGLDGTIRVWELETGKEVRKTTKLTTSTAALAVSWDNRYIVTGSDDKMVRILDFETLEEVKKFIGHSGAILSVALTPDNRNIVSGGQFQSWDSPVRTWGE